MVITLVWQEVQNESKIDQIVISAVLYILLEQFLSG